MSRVKFRCPDCGTRRFQFTFKDAVKNTPHGAVCCNCGRRAEANNLYQLYLIHQCIGWAEKS